ncbi:MAG: hypothetical protein HYZ09_04055 [Candidatus Kerfeldbacteria bacterium]|nr:hypothetical protein [Candidatus Kerfeldbacteria bacterium]
MPNEQTSLTTAEFRDAMNTLMGIVATKDDLKELEGRLPTRQQIDELSQANDAYTKKTETWHQEQTVLRASHDRVKKVLVKKGIASESELAV